MKKNTKVDSKVPENAGLSVGINLLYLIPGEMGGAETYALSLLSTMLRRDNNNCYCLFVNNTFDVGALPQTKNVEFVVAPISGHNRSLRYLWEQIVLPFQAALRRLNVLHSMHYVGPIIATCKTVLTIPDTNQGVIGRDMPLLRRLGLGTVSKLAAKTASAVVAVSNFSKDQICENLRIDPSKIRVIYSGCGWLQQNWTSLEAVRVKYKLHRSYIALFGGGYPHKNIPRFISAFSTLCKRFDIDLAIIGRLSPDVFLEEIAPEEVLLRIKPLGYVATEDIDPLLRGSLLLAFPSLYEGFGLPIVEAQRAGTPAICSDAAAIPEIAGKGAALFDPNDTSAMVETITKVLISEERRNELVELGSRNVQRFSWDKTVDGYLELYRELGCRYLPEINVDEVPARKSFE